MKQKEAYNLSNLSGDYTRSQYNLAFTNAKNALRRNAPADANLRGKKLREAAQQMVINAWRKTPDLGDVHVADEPMDDAQIAKENIMNKYENLHRFENEEPIAVPLMTPRVFGNYTQADLDKVSFNDAFGAARKAGQKTFYWRVGQNPKNKSGWYATQLASKSASNVLPVGQRPFYQYPDVTPSAPEFDPNSGYFYDMPEAPVYTQPTKPGTGVIAPSETTAAVTNNATSKPTSKRAIYDQGISIIGYPPLTSGIKKRMFVDGDDYPWSSDYYKPLVSAEIDSKRPNYYTTFRKVGSNFYMTFEPKEVIGPKPR